MDVDIGLALFLAAAWGFDVKTRKIPNMLNVLGAAAGATFHACNDGWSGLGYASVGLAVGFVIVLPLYSLRAVGAGDVKLFAAIGTWYGVYGVVYSAVYSILYAGIIGVIVLLTCGKLWGWIRSGVQCFRMFVLYRVPPDAARHRAASQAASHHRIPFMLAVVPGVVTVKLLSL